MRTLKLVFVTLVCALAWGASAKATDDSDIRNFYEYERSAIPGKPGELVDWKLLSKPIQKGKGFRVLYRTVGVGKQPTIASGLVFYPDGMNSSTQSRGLRRVVVWAHPTTGIVPRCAPSRLPEQPYEFQTISGLEDFLSDGFVVVAPDYVGLGAFPKGEESTTFHPYLNSELEASSIRDALRSSQALAVQLTKQGVLNGVEVGKEIALFGHSQGGQAALAAAALFTSPDNEFTVKSLVASAPPGNLAKLVPLQRTLIGQVLTTYIVKAMEIEDPSLRPADFLAQPLIDVKDEIANGCSVTEGGAQLAALKKAGLGDDPSKEYSGNHLTRPDLPANWTKALEARDPILLRGAANSASYPIVVTQGAADPLVAYRATRDDVVGPLCRVSGSKALFGVFPFAGHNQQFDYNSATAVRIVRSTLGDRPDLWPAPDALPTQDSGWIELAEFGFLVKCDAL